MTSQRGPEDTAAMTVGQLLDLLHHAAQAGILRTRGRTDAGNAHAAKVDEALAKFSGGP